MVSAWTTMSPPASTCKPDDPWTAADVLVAEARLLPRNVNLPPAFIMGACPFEPLWLSATPEPPPVPVTVPLMLMSAVAVSLAAVG